MAQLVDREGMKPLARNIAKGLLADLKSGKLTKIGIDEIRTSIFARTNETYGWNPDALDILEELTTRCVIESA